MHRTVPLGLSVIVIAALTLPAQAQNLSGGRGHPIKKPVDCDVRCGQFSEAQKKKICMQRCTAKQKGN